MQLELFEDEGTAEIALEDIFEAYFDCRKHKRKTVNALAFEADYETRLIELWKEINAGTYQPGRSVAFIVNKPVKREVFAADFRDRIVHHLIIGKLNPLFEQYFISDSYSCREGKGVQYGVERVASFIRDCSKDYTRDCYILKMDIQSFFMSIDKPLLFRLLQKFIVSRYGGKDKNRLLELVYKTIINCPEKNCQIKGAISNWEGLPRSKSLFTTGKDRGLPIGNLTSQIFANFYLDFFDKYVKDNCGIDYYGRYVDDFVIIHHDKHYLLKLQKNLCSYLTARLHLRLHPRKVYLQHYSKGVKFIGAVIKPGRIYIGNRTKGNLYEKIVCCNKKITDCPAENRKTAVDLQASINSYLGFMIHYKTFKIRQKMLNGYLLPLWHKYLTAAENAAKVSLKKIYRPLTVKIKKLKRRQYRN